MTDTDLRSQIEEQLFQSIEAVVDRYSVHQPRGYAKGTVARRGMKKRLNKSVAHYIKQLIQDRDTKLKEALLGGLPERYTMHQLDPPCPACGAEQGELHKDCPIEHAQKITKVAHDGVLDQTRTTINKVFEELV